MSQAAAQSTGQHRVVKDATEIARSFEVGQLVLVRKLDSKAAHRMEVAGWIENEAVILKGHRSLVTSGAFYYQNLIVVRYVIRGEAFGFRSHCLANVKDPTLIIIAWPDRVEALTLSNSRRQKVRLPARLHIPPVAEFGDERVFEVTLHDLSKGGCLLELVTELNVERVLSPDQKVMVSLTLAGGVELKRIWATIRAHTPQNGAVLLGMQFTETEQPELKQLAKVLDMQLAS